MTEYIEIIVLLKRAIDWCEDKEELKNSLTELLRTVVKEFAESLEN